VEIRRILRRLCRLLMKMTCEKARYKIEESVSIYIHILLNFCYVNMKFRKTIFDFCCIINIYLFI